MDRSLFELTPETRWLGQRLDVFAEVDSTNLVAEKLGHQGAPDGTVVIADRQTAGRGRLGRSFFSPGGRSLYLSVLLRPQLPLEQVHRHVFAAAVAVADSARAILPASCDIEIKWPNDVLIGGRKTSGINLPVHVDAGRVVFAVLGVGVNVNLAADELPEELREIATSLAIAGGKTVDRVRGEDLLAAARSARSISARGRFRGGLSASANRPECRERRCASAGQGRRR
jgi:BirA family biotin operon repressor/biotin-[acetyl-CoA-carboxylase] ligase